ncbi:MAG: WD40 repeat domain-containing protein [Spirochaetaceae bacterium]|nr:WD40 repeat domain-containing protein [Spirochaetaceae bacterium]
MARYNKKSLITIAVFALLLYAFVAAGPVTEETVLSLNWIASLEASYAERMPDDERLTPFELGQYFGYVSDDGRFGLNRQKQAYISMADAVWAEYGAQDESIAVKNGFDSELFRIENGRGYPLFLDSKTFIVHAEQNSVSLIAGEGPEAGGIVWTYDFASPLTCIDAAAGHLLAGALDGTIELIDGEGRRVYFSEPSGSRISAVFGCALSADGKKIAIVSGLDKQRFVLIEQAGAAWRITFHEFLEDGLRRNVFVRFVDDDNKVVFERENGLGVYDVKKHTSYKIPLDGDVIALEDGGTDRLLFLITSRGGAGKELVGIKFPNTVIVEAPFSSVDAFLSRKGSRLFAGGKTTLAAFTIEKK